MNLLAVAIFISYLILSACSTKCQRGESSSVIYKHYYFDSMGVTPAISTNRKILYRDSAAIEEVPEININTDTNHTTTITYGTLHYIYIDMGTKSFYFYKHFSDTARVIKSYILPDSVSADGVINFYYKQKTNNISLPEKLTDTIINNVIHSRVKLIVDIGKGPFVMVKYYRCDIKGTRFSLPKYRNDENPCPVVKIYSYELGESRPSTSTQIEYTSDYLSDNELKVFDAWEKNAKNNPVK